MSKLPDEQRRALTLRYYADLTIPEIARVPGWAEGTVKSRIHRGLRRLEDALKPLTAPDSGGPPTLAPTTSPTCKPDSATSMRDEQ
jgi:RNA polymerase sigma-70 factor (ECF subfamily)